MFIRKLSPTVPHKSLRVELRRNPKVKADSIEKANTENEKPEEKRKNAENLPVEFHAQTKSRTPNQQDPINAYRNNVRTSKFRQARAFPPCAPSVVEVSNPISTCRARVLKRVIRSVECKRRGGFGCAGWAYKSLHGSVKSVPVVAAELGVGSLEGRVTEGLGLLEAVTVGPVIEKVSFCSLLPWTPSSSRNPPRSRISTSTSTTTESGERG